MSALYKLWLFKAKGFIRNLFSKPSSTIFTLLMVFIYGGLFLMLFFTEETGGGRFNKHLSIMIAIGFCALMIFLLLMQKRKALLFETDSYYLFSGPFSKENVMEYLSLQSITQSMLFAALSVYIMACYTIGTKFSVDIYILIFIVCALLVYFFLLLIDYIYILSITNEKYKKISYVISFLLLFSLVALFVYIFITSNMRINDAFMNFVLSDLFYAVPFFGWAKLSLISYIEGNYLLFALGALLLIVSILVVKHLFVHFKGDFYEQALADSITLTEMNKRVKEGKAISLNEGKIKDVKSSFKQGAKAITSKNILIMRKTNSLIRGKDILILVMYLFISYFSNMGYGFFMYMTLLYVYIFLQESEMFSDLENYQIYLIPEKPIKKLFATISSTALRLTVICVLAMIIGGFIFQATIFEIINYILMILGYLYLFISASVLSLRILKSRSNKMMTALTRMLLLLLTAIPSLILLGVIYIVIQPNTFVFTLMAMIIPPLFNLIFAYIILLCCANMLNGRELNSD